MVTSTVVDWFCDTPEKDHHRFLKFDIIDFYPSIKEKLLSSAITFAKRFTEISEETIKFTRNARRSLFFNSNSVWVKKSGNFDVAMRTLDGAEIYELVGLFLLDKLANILVLGKKNVGFYRDDGLAVIKGSSGSKMEKIINYSQNTTSNNFRLHLETH